MADNSKRADEPQHELSQDDDNAAGIDDAGTEGEDRDILGKKQEDLDEDDLAGDARSTGSE
ncbi:MAG: hypothetical protein EON55_09220 [Alphaproteobacteria bacterium]|nr:MAG: hypothetical protein EON55_09220 [Alphaproteobacteria bacterium]